MKPFDNRPAWIPSLPAILLVLIALHQIYLSKTADLSPWKGGGFGMFSSTDYASSRYVRLYVSAPGRAEEVQISESLSDFAQRTAVLPSDRFLQKLAELVVSREKKRHRPVSTVRIEVWRTEFHPITLIPSQKRIKVYAATF